MAHRISRVVTRTGDDGTTGLVGGARVPKDDARIEALGAVDELNSQLGLLRAANVPEKVARQIEEMQQDLFDLGAVIAGAAAEKWDGASQTVRLESQIEKINAALPPLEEFLLPGGGLPAAQCHAARAVCRRAERRVVAVEGLPPAVRVYLNRLSDLLFVLARALAQEGAENERLWRGYGAPGQD